MDWVSYKMLKRDPDKEVKCATCKHTSKNGCTLFKNSADVWDNCLGGEGYTRIFKDVIVPDGWTKPMPYAYVFWQAEEHILPEDLFEI